MSEKKPAHLENFSWGNGDEAEKRFSFEKTIANTLQGRIYLGKDKETDKHIIIKEAWKSLIAKGISRTRHAVHENFTDEVALIKYISNMNDCPIYICQSMHNWEDKEAYFVALEKCDIGLFEYIKICHKRMKLKNYNNNNNDNFLKKPTKWINLIGPIFRQIVLSVNWLHNIGICHLDLSLENIMLLKKDGGYIPKIIDFGVGVLFDEKVNFKYNKKVGKGNYMACEVYAIKDDKQYYDARAADIHTLGVILFMMLTGAPPYEKPVMKDQLYKLIITKKMKLILKSWKFLNKMTEDAYDLIDKIIKPEKDRIVMKDLLTHPFVTRFKEDTNQDENNDDEKKEAENEHINENNNE